MLLRSGPVGVLVLICYSLPLSYASPDGNKPLVRSGRLVEQANRRLRETGRFVLEVCRPGGMRPGGAGFNLTVRVRLMHAQVRRLLLRSGDWDVYRYGFPINQAYMAATNVLFSAVMLEGLDRLGAKTSDEDKDNLVALWRYTGTLMGVAPEICPATYRDGLSLSRMINGLQSAPDDDSRRLVHALMHGAFEDQFEPNVAARAVKLCYGVSRHLIGDQLADAFEYPPVRWHQTLRLLKPLLKLSVIPQRLGAVPRTLTRRVGHVIWERLVDEGMAGISSVLGEVGAGDGAGADEGDV